MTLIRLSYVYFHTIIYFVYYVLNWNWKITVVYLIFINSNFFNLYNCTIIV